MSKHERRRQFKTPQQLDRSVAGAARLLIQQVPERIDARGRVSSSLIARIAIDNKFVAVSFVDYPDEYMDLVEWKQR